MTRVAQHGFMAGELSPTMYGRPDDSQYGYGVSRAKNFFVRPQGGLRSRPGFEYVSTCKYPNKKVRLIPFVFSSTQTMVLEFGDYYMRVILQGALLVYSNGTAYEISTPFSEDEIFDFHYEQSADVVTITHINHVPMQLKRYGMYDWRFENLNFGAKISAPSSVWGSATYTSDVEAKYKGKISSSYCVTAVDADGHESVRSPVCSISGNYTLSGCYNTISWSGVSGADHYRVYRYVGGVYGYIGATDTTSIKDENIASKTTDTPPRYDTSLNAASSGTNIKAINVSNPGSGYPNMLLVSLKGTSMYIPPLHPFSFSIDGDLDLDPYCFRLTVMNAVTLQVVQSLLIEFRLLRYCNDEVEGKTIVVGIPKGLSASEGMSVNMLEKISSGDYTVQLIVWNRNLSTVVTSALDTDGDSITISSGGETYTYNYIQEDSAYSSFNSITDSTIATAMRGSGAIVSNIISWQSSRCVVLTINGGSGAEAVATVSNGAIVSVNVLSSGSNYSKPSISISSPTGSGASFSIVTQQTYSNYPGANGEFEQRRWLAGTEMRPLTIWGTASGTDDELSYHLPLQDDDRIKVQAMTRDANRILHIIGLQNLLMFTASAEWMVSSASGGAITPSNISVKPQSYFGSTNVQPLIATNQAIFATARGGHLREIGYSRDVYGYLSNDIALRATHLFDGYRIVDMAYSKAPFPRVNVVSSSGNLNVATYMPEQSICAWTETVTQNGAFESVACVSEGGEEGEDVMYVVVARTINNTTVRYIERLGKIDEFTNNSLICLDSSLSGQFSTPNTEISGLSHLEGQSVAVLADGEYTTGYTVRNGSITLSKAASNVHVGLPIDCYMASLPFIVLGGTGSGKGLMKNISHVSVQLRHKGKLSAGPTLSQVTPLVRDWKDKYKDEVAEDLVTEEQVVIRGKWDENGQVVIKKTDCFPVELVSLTLDCEVGK